LRIRLGLFHECAYGTDHDRELVDRLFWIGLWDLTPELVILSDFLVVGILQSFTIMIHPAPWASDFNQLPTVLPLLVCGFPSQIRTHRFLRSVVVTRTDTLDSFVFIDFHIGALVTETCSLRNNAADSVMSFHNE
jgi:hypothetical protein